MKKVSTEDCLCHVLVCVNRRQDPELPCCADGGGAEVYSRLRHWLEERQLLSRIWLTRTECMGWCHRDGTTVAFYPEGVWYRAVKPDDCVVLVEAHLEPLI